MKCLNKSCGKDFDLKENMIIKRGQKMFKCPFCKTNHVNTGSSKDYLRTKTGQLIRKNRKVKMSKKERLKLRRNND